MGVRRAVEMAESSIANSGTSGGSRRVYTSGPLIHNPSILAHLSDHGIGILNEGELPSPSEDATVIIRAHGIAPEKEALLTQNGAHIEDATCPYVKRSQRRAHAFAKAGCRIFLAGEANHAEIIGIRGYIESAVESAGLPSCYIVGTSCEAKKAAKELLDNAGEVKTALIGQTTISPSEYQAIGQALQSFFPKIEIADTICNATTERQDALRELCTEVEAVIIVGGKESSNTRRLLSLAEGFGKPAWLVQTADELPPEIGKYETVGISAGASTPDSIIAGIEQALRRIIAHSFQFV